MDTELLTQLTTLYLTGRIRLVRTPVIGRGIIQGLFTATGSEWLAIVDDDDVDALIADDWSSWFNGGAAYPARQERYCKVLAWLTEAARV